MDAGTAPTKDPGEPRRREQSPDLVDCGQLGICSMAEFDALLDQYLPETPDPQDP